jgi:hypothetical protein
MRIPPQMWLVAWAAACLFLCAPATRSEFDFDSMTLVDAVDCATDSTHDFTQYPAQASALTTLLGAPCRTLAMTGTTMKYFAYRLGRNAGLEAHKAYVLRVIYPEDQPRTIFVLNRGSETTRAFHTGRTTGDGIHVPYVQNNAESLELPLSGNYETWDMLFYLQERFPGIKHPRDPDEFPRDQEPEDGFWVLFLQLSPTNDPLSAGVAIKRIELYEAPSADELKQPIPTLPTGLPRRHLFWREEMADGVISSTDVTKRGFADDMGWYETKFQLMHFLGMRTFAKDLLEFGANQGWDSSKYGGNNWVYQSSSPARWTRIVRRCAELGFDLMPYYEYKGSKGAQGLGYEKRARPLSDSLSAYTHITWSEDANVDITDPDTFEDLRKILEITVADERENGSFAGVWLRSRVSDFPVSFSNRCLALFQSETGQTSAVTRARLRSEPLLYSQYREWWFEKRHAFLEQVRDYIRTIAGPEMSLLFTTDNSEPGKTRLPAHASDVIAEDPSKWNGTGKSVRSLANALSGKWQLQTLLADTETWGGWEWQHAVPHSDPHRYQNTDGIHLTQTFNRAYTIEKDVGNAFRAKDGLAMVRHYSLNEDATQVGSDRRIVGYFSSDVDYAGPFVVLPEALAMAYEDPRFIGYLAGGNFNRGNPHYVRKFNANFLALPALPSVVDTSQPPDSDFVVRRITTPSNGTYLAAIHIGRHPATKTIHLPEPGALYDAVTGELLDGSATSFTLDMSPCELRAFRYFPHSTNTPPEISVDEAHEVPWFHALGTHGQWQTVNLKPRIRDYDWGDRVESVSWSVAAEHAGNAVFLDHTAAETMVAFNAPGTYVLTLTVSDGTDLRTQNVTLKVMERKERIKVTPSMVTPVSPGLIDMWLFDCQDQTGEPPHKDVGSRQVAASPWIFPMESMVDLGQQHRITEVWLLDYNGVGTFKVFSGSPSSWSQLLSYNTNSYISWKRFPVDVTTRYLKFHMDSGGALVAEVVLYGTGGGFDFLEDPPYQPISMKLSPGAEGLRIASHTNPFHDYVLEHTEDLRAEGWTEVDSWSSDEPFHFSLVPLDGTAGFFRIIEAKR